MVRDLKYLLDETDTVQDVDIALWDDHHKYKDFGVSYGKEGEDD